jgi:hypothetical protein
VDTKNPINKFASGDVCFWIEQESSIHLKAVDKFSDPVELTEIEAREIAETLLKMANQ